MGMKQKQRHTCKSAVEVIACEMSSLRCLHNTVVSGLGEEGIPSVARLLHDQLNIQALSTHTAVCNILSENTQQIHTIFSSIKSIPLAYKQLEPAYFHMWYDINMVFCYILKLQVIGELCAQGDLILNNITVKKNHDVDLELLTSIKQHPKAEQVIIKSQREFRKNIAYKLCKLLYHKNPKDFMPFKDMVCSDTLKARILDIAKNKSFINNLKHKTCLKSLKSMLESSVSQKELLMYGALNILVSKKAYINNALGDGDIKCGDANTICFGLDHGRIDELCNTQVTIIVDFQQFKISNKGSAIFVKDHDFAFIQGEQVARTYPNYSSSYKVFNEIKKFSIDIGGINCKIYRNLNEVYFEIQGNEPITVSMQNSDSVCYNTDQIEEFLLLQFFRYLESMPSEDIKTKIYSALSQMNNQDLTKCLVSLAKAMSDTAEIDVHGAATLDASCIQEIILQHSEEEIHFVGLNDFIERITDYE